jgi:hypothetical protein
MNLLQMLCDFSKVTKYFEVEQSNEAWLLDNFNASPEPNEEIAAKIKHWHIAARAGFSRTRSIRAGNPP